MTAAHSPGCLVIGHCRKDERHLLKLDLDIYQDRRFTSSGDGPPITVVMQYAAAAAANIQDH